MRLLYSPAASADLHDIFDYIEPHHPRAAEETILRLEQTALLLEQFPMLGQAGRVEGTREFFVPGLRYVLIYRIEEARGVVRILRILHTRRQWPTR